MNNDELGALWQRTTQNGETYWTGSITIDDTAYPVVVFQNKHKKHDRQPDMRILRSKPKQEQDNLPDNDF